MERITAMLIVTVMVMSGFNSAALLIATVGNSGSVPENFTVTLDLKGLPLDPDMVFTPEQETDSKDIAREKSISQVVTINPRRNTGWVISQLFSSNSYFVVGEEAYTTDILGTSHISYGLALGGAFENPQGRTDTILTREERDQGNLIIVGGPDVNPAATEFGGPCSVEIRGFKSLPPHFLWVLLGIRGRILLFLQALSVHQRKQGLHLYALSTRAYKTKQGDRNMISALDDILEDFLMYLRVERSISGGVARCYCWSVGRFLRWTDTLNPDRRDAVKYLDRLWKERKKESTIRNILFGLKHYYSLLAKNWI